MQRNNSLFEHREGLLLLLSFNGLVYIPAVLKKSNLTRLSKSSLWPLSELEVECAAWFPTDGVDEAHHAARVPTTTATT